MTFESTQQDEHVLDAYWFAEVTREIEDDAYWLSLPSPSFEDALVAFSFRRQLGA